jgi:uncharacterized membrane protein YfcA
MDFVGVLIIFAVGLIGGSFGTLVGGGSLLTIPTLIFLGLPPRIAVATNRLGVTGGSVSGLYEFHRKRFINYRIGFVVGIPALAGSVLGANIVLQTDEVLLGKIIGVVTILILIFVMAKPEIGLKRAKRLISKNEYLIGGVIGFLLGIYGGFYGAGSGTFFSYLLIMFFGQTFLESAGTRKIALLLMSFTASIVFAINGAIVYYLAVSLFIGMFIGSYLGAHYSDRIGNVWIKRLFFVIVLVMGIRLLF